MLRLILEENSFQFDEKEYLQIHATAIGTKMAVAFTNIFLAHGEANSYPKRQKSYSLETLN